MGQIISLNELHQNNQTYFNQKQLTSQFTTKYQICQDEENQPVILKQNENAEIHVYQHKITNEEVIVKVLYSNSQKYFAKQAQEIQKLISLLGNQHYVQYKDHYIDKQEIDDILGQQKQQFLTVIVTNKGITLKQFLKKKIEFSQDNKLFIILQLLNIGREMEQAEIVHKDLKLDNIIIYNNQIQIIDLGSAYNIIKQTNQHKNIPQKRYSGTLGYMSPEMHKLFQKSNKNKQTSQGSILKQLYNKSNEIVQEDDNGQEQKEQDESDILQFYLKSDVFSLGIVIYQIVSGTYKFKNQQNKNYESQLKNLQYIRYDIISNLNIDQRLKYLLIQMLEENPEDRISFCQAYCYFLQQFKDNKQVIMRYVQKQINNVLSLIQYQKYQNAIQSLNLINNQIFQQVQRLKCQILEAYCKFKLQYYEDLQNQVNNILTDIKQNNQDEELNFWYYILLYEIIKKTPSKQQFTDIITNQLYFQQIKQGQQIVKDYIIANKEQNQQFQYLSKLHKQLEEIPSDQIEYKFYIKYHQIKSLYKMIYLEQALNEIYKLKEEIILFDNQFNAFYINLQIIEAKIQHKLLNFDKSIELLNQSSNLVQQLHGQNSYFHSYILYQKTKNQIYTKDYYQAQSNIEHAMKILKNINNNQSYFSLNILFYKSLLLELNGEILEFRENIKYIINHCNTYFQRRLLESAQKQLNYIEDCISK